jgi:hypothetical protein
MQYWYKNTQVISEKAQESGVFDIYYCVQKFLARTIFWVNFLHFNCFEFGIKFCVLWYPYNIFSKKLH